MLALVLLLIAYAVALCSILAAAFIVGGRDERRFAAIVALGFVTSQLAISSGARWTSIEVAACVNDALLTVAMGWVAVTSRKFWPIWGTAAQFNATLTHGVAILRPEVNGTVYALSATVWVVPVLLALAFGTGQVWRDRHRRLISVVQPATD